MAQIKVIRMDQSEGESMEVDESLAGVPYHAYIIRDLVVYQEAKARQGTHAGKTGADGCRHVRRARTVRNVEQCPIRKLDLQHNTPCMPNTLGRTPDPAAHPGARAPPVH